MSILPFFLGEGLPKYKYTPIAPTARTFRVAKLLTPEPSLIPGCAPTLRIALLECEAGSASSRASIDYDALSYAWDVPPHVKRPNRRIIVEAGTERSYMYIYRPLELALLRFAAANAGGSDSEARYELPIFIDQICINQDDDVEKAHQVALMQDIYARCRRAVIWLGPATPASDLLFAYVRDVCADGVLSGLLGPRVASAMRVFDAAINPSITLTDATELQDRANLVALIDRCAGQYPYAAYLDVLRRSWFRRLWTIQEACLAADAVFVCGDAQLCFDCFRAGSFFYSVQNSWWLRHQSGPVSKAELRTRDAVLDALEGFRRIFQERKMIHQLGRRVPLHELVIKHSLVTEAKWKVGATLAQDRIYGLLGLAAANDPVRTRLSIYYDKTNQEAAQVKAFQEVAGLFLEQGHMDVVLLNQTPKTTPGLPSWAPDWAMELVLPVAWSALHEPIFAAGGEPQTTSSAARADPSTGTIYVKGVLVGRVAAVGQTTYRAQRHQRLLEEIARDAVVLVLAEVDQFVRAAATSAAAAAAAQSSSAAPDELPVLDETVLAHTALRVCDSGRSARHFTTQFGSAAAAFARMQALCGALTHLGGRDLRVAATRGAYASPLSIYRSLGITPWYVDMYGSTRIARRLARGPVAVARVVVRALTDFAHDVYGVCAAWAYFQLHTARGRLRRRWATTLPMQVPDERLRAAGLDPAVALGGDTAALTTNMLLNAGRHVFRTEEGHVGMGPGAMAEGDVVVVLHGVSTPVVLRRVMGGRGREEWTLVGEAYCDGVMAGEALGVNEREFVLV